MTSDMSSMQMIFALKTEEKDRLSRFPYFNRDPSHTGDGVLLSDQIEFYCRKYGMIGDFSRECLQPAGYTLRIGNNYAIDGKCYTLNENGSLTIQRYQVAIIQTFETLNLPQFLIGRWNIRVTLAYDGLLWVGGAQVDPGFRGRLSCPIYNLSAKEVVLQHGERLAMIDFVTTTPFRRGVSKPYVWNNPKRKLVFEEYNTSLTSGVEDQLKKQDKEIEAGKQLVERQIKFVRKRIDEFVALVFAVIAVLFAALGIVATKGSQEVSFWSSTVWVSAFALYFALKPYYIAWNLSRRDRGYKTDGSDTDLRHVSDKGRSGEDKWYSSLVPNSLEFGIAGLVIAALLVFHFCEAHFAASELRYARDQADAAMMAIERQNQEFEARNRESNVKLESLQQQVNLLRGNLGEGR
jgi:deoxycytidine triphosphate deaminase